MSTNPTKSKSIAELLSAVRGETNIKRIASELFKAIMPGAQGLDATTSAAPELCVKHALINPHFLANILVVIEAHCAMHQPGGAKQQKQAQQRRLRRHLSEMKRTANAIKREISGRELGGVVVALEPDHNIFSTMEVVSAVHALSLLELSAGTDVDYAFIYGCVMPLGEFWYDGRNEIPEGSFELAKDGWVPVKGTAADFVVDALASTSWSFQNEQIKRAFEEVSRVLAGRDAAGVLPEASVTAETVN